MHTVFSNKCQGFGVGTLIPPSVKNVFRDDLTRNDLEIIWNEIKVEGKKVLIGNMYVPPYNEEQLEILDRVLENIRNENIILLGDFNARNTIWDKQATKNTKLGEILEDIIQRHGLHIVTDVDHT